MKNTSRKAVSLSIALIFLVLSLTGVLSYFKEYSRVLATVHTTFGILFIVGVLFHLFNNFKPLKAYSKSRVLLFILAIGAIVLAGTLFQTEPFLTIMDKGAALKASSGSATNLSQIEVMEMNMDNDIQLSIDLLRAEFYWHPQMAVWIEDTLGQYVETLFVSKATAQGLFFGGRSKENFKEFDEKKTGSGEYRRVNALPVWSHQRGVKYADGMYVPTQEEPLPDAITGATFIDNFRLISSTTNAAEFQVRVEINVAFDDNEFYSEYDFPDDEVFHNGTGQLGQPSIIFEAAIDMNDQKEYYLMNLIGHGHRSGQTGEISRDLSKLTTAKEIVERIVVGVKNG